MVELLILMIRHIETCKAEIRSDCWDLCRGCCPAACHQGALFVSRMWAEVGYTWMCICGGKRPAETTEIINNWFASACCSCSKLTSHLSSFYLLINSLNGLKKLLHYQDSDSTLDSLLYIFFQDLKLNLSLMGVKEKASQTLMFQSIQTLMWLIFH